MYIFTQPDYKSQIEDFCKSQTKNKKFKNFSWHYHFVISYVFIKPFIDKQYVTGDFIPINGAIGRKLISNQEFKTIIDNLIHLNIIECDYYYQAGVKSLGYRFLEYKTGWKLTPIKDKALNSKLDKIYSEYDKEISIKGPGYQSVNYWNKKLFIDNKKALKFINEKLNLEIEDFFNNFKTNKKTDLFFNSIKDIYKSDSNIDNIAETLHSCFYNKGVDKSFLKLKGVVDFYISAKISILLFNEHKFATVDPTGNRFHSNLTNLSRLLRPFLSVNNEKLYQVDIANSQPTFLGLLMKNRDNVNKQELDKYLECCSEGKFYEYIAKTGGFKGDLNDKDIRKEFKIKIFTGILFDRNRSQFSKWELIFQSTFPTIFKEIRNIKNNNYKELSKMLQCEESSFIFDCVDNINKISKNGAPLLTIHDSILSNKININQVKEIIKKSFKLKYKYEPKIEITKI